MHAYVTSAPEIEFETSFNVASELPGMDKRGTAHFVIRRPDRFRVEVSSGKGDYVFVSDGATFTLYRPKERIFARIPARDSILGTMYVAAGLLNIQTRLLDFLWTVDYGENVKVTAGALEAVGGRQCRRFDVDRFEDDFEVWLEPEGTPLPCRLISRRTDGNARTVQTNEFNWKPARAIAPETFVFSPPAGSREVGVSDLD
jgi:hypothetical protein